MFAILSHKAIAHHQPTHGLYFRLFLSFYCLLSNWLSFSPSSAIMWLWFKAFGTWCRTIANDLDQSNFKRKNKTWTRPKWCQDVLTTLHSRRERVRISEKIHNSKKFFSNLWANTCHRCLGPCKSGIYYSPLTESKFYMWNFFAQQFQLQTAVSRERKEIF